MQIKTEGELRYFKLNLFFERPETTDYFATLLSKLDITTLEFQLNLDTSPNDVFVAVRPVDISTKCYSAASVYIGDYGFTLWMLLIWRT